MSESEEAALVRRFQTGDEEAFRVLVQNHSKVLFGTAYLMTHDRGLVEDAVQSTLIQMWKHLPSTRLRGSLRAWLMRILVNELKQQFRKNHVATVSLEQVPEMAGEPDEIETALTMDEERRHLMIAMQALPAEQKEAVVLRYFTGLTVPEIAEVMRERQGTIKSRLSRAVDRLGEILSRDKIFEYRS